VDLLLSNGDLSITNGQLQLTSSIAVAAAQRIATRLRLFQGEWFLDTGAGTPYFQQILNAPPDMNVLASIFRRVVLADSYVLAVPSCVCTLAARALTVRFIAIVDTGAGTTSAATFTLVGGIEGGLVVTGIQVVVDGVPIVVTP
jgi:hypothetical protein